MEILQVVVEELGSKVMVMIVKIDFHRKKVIHMEVLEVKVEEEVMAVNQIKAIMKKMNGRVNLKRKLMCGVMMYYFIIKCYDY